MRTRKTNVQAYFWFGLVKAYLNLHYSHASYCCFIALRLGYLTPGFSCGKKVAFNESREKHVFGFSNQVDTNRRAHSVVCLIVYRKHNKAWHEKANEQT